MTVTSLVATAGAGVSMRWHRNRMSATIGQCRHVSRAGLVRVWCSSDRAVRDMALVLVSLDCERLPRGRER
jgi:hypothetical protein